MNIENEMPMSTGPILANQNVMDPIVVTGATGRVAHLVAEELLALGCRVRAVGRTMEKLRPLAKLGADARVGGLGLTRITVFLQASSKARERRSFSPPSMSQPKM